MFREILLMILYIYLIAYEIKYNRSEVFYVLNLD